MRDLTQFQCPKCGKEDSSHFSKTCNECGHDGDWIQAGELMTYADTKKFFGVESISDLVPDLAVFHYQVPSFTK